MSLRFHGSQHFRQRLACATLSGRTIRIDNIRARDENPGLRDYEASLLRLLEKITNGCVVEINETGAASGLPRCNRDLSSAQFPGGFLPKLQVPVLKEGMLTCGCGHVSCLQDADVGHAS